MKKLIIASALLGSTVIFGQNTGIGTTNPTEKLEVAGNIKSTTINSNTGSSTDKVVVADATGVLKTVDRKNIDTNAWHLWGNTVADTDYLGTLNDKDLIFKRYGKDGGRIGQYNTVFGYTALPETPGAIYNTVVGIGAAKSLTSGYSNTVLGGNALMFLANGINNTVLGNNALAYLKTGSNNIALGNITAYQMTKGDDNLLLGNSIGISLSEGTNNIVIGNNIEFPQYVAPNMYSASNQLIIGNVIFGYNINDISATNDLIGIATSSPTETFDVNGTARVRTLNTGSATDKVVVADTNGVLKTVDRSTLASAGWNLTGNSGTTPATNFLGTTDDKDLIFKRNNVSAGILNSQNTAFGAGAMKSLNLASSMFNTAIGNDSQLALTSGNANTSVGFASLRNITSGSGNTAVGNMAMMSTMSGADNVSIGKGAGNNSSTGGTGNILIGAGANKPFSTTGNYQLNIGDWIFGDNGKIGIGAAYKPSYGAVDNLTLGKTMTEQLEVDGSAKLLKINSAAYVGTSTDKVVVADANGVLKLKPADTPIPANSAGNVAANTVVSLGVDTSKFYPVLIKNINGITKSAAGYSFDGTGATWTLTFYDGDSNNVSYEIMWQRRAQ